MRLPAVKTNPAAPPPTRGERAQLVAVGTYWHLALAVGLAWRRRVVPVLCAVTGAPLPEAPPSPVWSSHPDPARP